MKKHSFITILLIVLMSMVCTTSFAYDIAVKNADNITIYYVWTNNNTELAVSDNSTSKYTGNVVIPSSVEYNGNSYSVTSIGDEAFDSCRGLTSVTIPNSVTSIGFGAFWGCTGLTSVTIPNSVTTINPLAFDCCSGLTSITIPSSVTYIGWDAFDGCDALSSVNITDLLAWLNIVFDSTGGTTNSENPLYYANHLFLNGTEIKDLIIPDGVTSIGNHTFNGCSGLTSISIPNSVTSIGKGAFSGCGGLTSLTIPNSVKSIGNYAFSGCSGLTSVTIPNSVTIIVGYAFYNCSGLKTIVSEIENPFGINENAFNCPNKDIYSTATLIVPTGKKSVYQNTAGWSKFQNIIEAGEGGIVGHDFEADGILYKIGENNTVSVIQNSSGYSGDIVIPTHVFYNKVNYIVTTIGSYAFDKSTELTSISIPPTVTSIEYGAFYDYLFNLKAVHIMDLKAWCNINIDGDYTDTNPLSWADHLYLNGEEIKDLVIPSGVVSINDGAFYCCNGLNSVTIPNSVTNIGDGAFSGCNGLNSVTIPNSVTSIGQSAFSHCSSLNSVTIPNSVTSIGEAAFAYCKSLNTIVSEIRSPSEISNSAFSNYTTVTLIVPPGKKSAYQNTAGWNKFTNIVEAELIGYEFEYNGIRYKIRDNNTVSVVPRNAKYSGDIVIPNQVAFNGVTYSVTTIGDSAFDGCTDVTSVTIPNGVTTIEDGGFYKCSGLKSVNIPDGVTTIGLGAFSGCSSLTSVTIPSSVTSIGKYAFDKCTSLNRIVSERVQPIAIDKSVFETYDDPHNVYTMATLVVPSGSKSTYQNTEGWKKFTNIVEEQKCAKPTISYNNGKISFSCETEGVEFHYSISNTNSSTGIGSSVSFTPTVTISVYASKSGFANSDTSTVELEVPASLRGDVNKDGTVNVADHVELTKIIMNEE